MANLDRQQLKNEVDIIHQTYQIENFVYEAINLYDFWSSNRASSRSISIDGEDITDLLPKTEFYPAVRHALLILLTLPVTTCTIERSFSTLRRVKTWLPSTMADDRLPSLCMMSVHRQKAKEQKNAFMEIVINRFGSDSRRVQFLFK